MSYTYVQITVNTIWKYVTNLFLNFWNWIKFNSKMYVSFSISLKSNLYFSPFCLQMCALLGTSIIPLTYLTVQEMTKSVPAALLASSLILFGKTILAYNGYNYCFTECDWLFPSCFFFSQKKNKQKQQQTLHANVVYNYT